MSRGAPEQEAILSAELELQRWRDIMFSGNQDDPPAQGKAHGANHPGSVNRHNYPPMEEQSAAHLPGHHMPVSPYDGMFDFSPSPQGSYAVRF